MMIQSVLTKLWMSVSVSFILIFVVFFFFCTGRDKEGGYSNIGQAAYYFVSAKPDFSFILKISHF